MSKVVFQSHNKVGETFSFQTDSNSGTTFDPIITFLGGGSDRVSWDLGDDGGFVADNSLSHTYPDSGDVKTVMVRTNRLSNLKGLRMDNDDVCGTLNLTKWNNLGGAFLLMNNQKLTGITHTTSTGVFTDYRVNNCDLTGNHDVSMLTGLGGQFLAYSNLNLTGITHTASTEVFTDYRVQNCNLTGNYDVSMLTGLGGSFLIHRNSSLTDVTFPTSTQTFKNGFVSDFSAFVMHSCDLGYVDFTPLSGINMDTGSTYGASIYLNDNNMTTGEVNHILSDFSGMTSSNLSGWSGVVLVIGGTNSAPDNSSGGFNGSAAISYLTSATPNWTIITS